MEICKDVAAIIGLILSVISLITLCTKAGRSEIKRIFQRHTKEIVEENSKQSRDLATLKQELASLKAEISELKIIIEALKIQAEQQCRDTLKDIYYRYYSQKRLPLYERKTADYTYAIYRDTFNGNSYAKLLYEEICKWEIDTVSFDNLEM